MSAFADTIGLCGVTTRRSPGSMLTPAGNLSLYAEVSSVPITATSPLSSSHSSGQLASPPVEPSSCADLPRRLTKLAAGSASHLPLIVKTCPFRIGQHGCPMCPPTGSLYGSAYSVIGNTVNRSALSTMDDRLPIRL